jgi:hypothetical protein
MAGTSATTEVKADHTVVFTLRDGKTLTVGPQMRLLFGRSVGSEGAPVIGGTDQGGSFVAAFLHQDGLPVGCWTTGVGDTGVEYGIGIVIESTLWPKADTFSAPGGVPAFDHEYPDGTRFCFDATGHVASAVTN